MITVEYLCAYFLVDSPRPNSLKPIKFLPPPKPRLMILIFSYYAKTKPTESISEFFSVKFTVNMLCAIALASLLCFLSN